MDHFRGLTEYGLGVYRMWDLSPEEREAQIAAGKAKLLESEEQCTLCCKLLERVAKTRSINNGWSSYGLKALVEKETGKYISNGAFITAAIHCGFAYKTRPDYPNVLFGMSERSLKAIKDEIERPAREAHEAEMNRILKLHA